jgi:hypothetical protein
MTRQLSSSIIVFGGTADLAQLYSAQAPEGGWAAETPRTGVAVAKFHARPSTQYRYEHYDPRFSE